MNSRVEGLEPPKQTILNVTVPKKAIRGMMYIHTCMYIHSPYGSVSRVGTPQILSQPRPPVVWAPLWGWCGWGLGLGFGV